jgi:hypothetical protein
MQTPGFKYSVNYDSIRSHTPGVKYYGKPETAPKFEMRPKKSSKPAPGSYNVDECYVKSQFASTSHTFMKEKPKNYIDIAVKTRSSVPGIGKYKDIEKGYSALSRPLSSIARKR